MAQSKKKAVDPLSKFEYSLADDTDGLVQVYDPATGQTGFFTTDNRYVSGDIKYANRQLVGWIGRLALLKPTGAEG